MRKGFHAAVVLDENGEIFAISTGSDAAAEHEGGSKPMQQALCPSPQQRPDPGLLAKVAQACGLAQPAPQTDDELVGALRKGQAVSYPALLERKAITRNLDKLHYVVGEEKGEPVAVFGYAPRGLDVIRIDHGELPIYSNEDCAGAWDEREFAIKVRGQDMVDKLKRFAEKAKAGDALFAGTFLKSAGDSLLSGVIIALRSGLKPEHQEEIAKAQLEWEATLRLKAKSQVDELHRLSRNKQDNPHAQMPGYIWPVWTEGPDSDVAYGLNPGYQIKADYYGPYTFDELKDWILAETKYHLAPVALRRNRATA